MKKIIEVTLLDVTASLMYLYNVVLLTPVALVISVMLYCLLSYILSAKFTLSSSLRGVFRNLKMQKNAALRYTAFCIKIQDWTGVTVEHKPPYSTIASRHSVFIDSSMVLLLVKCAFAPMFVCPT